MSEKRESHVNELLKQLCSQQLSGVSAGSSEISRAYQRCCRTLDTRPLVCDENQVKEEIRKKLSTTKGYNVAHTYIDCYDNLVKLDGPKNRGGVLYFLTLLSDSKSKSDVVALLKTNPASSFRQSDSTAVAPCVLPNRDLAVKNRNEVLVKPRYATVVLSPETFDGYSEADLVRDLLFVFQGIATNAIRWEASRMCYVPQPAIKLPKPKLDLACKLAELGFLYKQIKSFVDQRLSEQSYGLIGQAFCSAIMQELREYYRLIATLENQNTLGKLSLHRLLVWSHDTFDQLRLLSSLCVQAGYLNGGALASSLHTFLQYGDPNFHLLVKKVLHITTRPLLEMLRRWIYEGECCDAYGEFFITVDSDTPEDLLWESKYSIRLEMLPSFISKQMAERILLIGKTINFIRVVCRDHSPINFPFSTVATTNQGLNDIIGPDLNGHVSEVYKITSSHLIGLLKKKYLLCEHLTAIRDYLLLGQGDFIQHLMDLICKDLSGLSSSLQTSMLQSKLETAQRATNAQYHNVDVIRRVSVIKLEESGGDTGWDVFTIDYVLNCPLTVIVNQDSRETYLCIFRMLWKTKRIEHGLRRMWGKTATWDRTLPHIVGDIREFRHQINIICCEMQHFISQVQYYINFEVLECSWKELENAVDTAENLDHIIEAHKRFLGIVSERLMLNQEHLQVLTKLYANYKNAINFMDAYDKAHEVLKKANIIRAKRHDSMNLKTKQGDWGIKAADEAAIVQEDKEFQAQLKAIAKIFTNNQSTFSTSLRDFLMALSLEADDSMKFLSLRIDFNEHYKQKHGNNFNGPYINRTKSVDA
ncbi:gamma-tubulin complex component 3-like [Bolinopsis microptera]|uniref:gamma-tubulin complex component 3-like n=1 Tax=Bolinopsis microptera TaxID=2820187 RepID=UPI003079D9F9